MTRDELVAWVHRGESEHQEFKATTGQRTDAAKTLCARSTIAAAASCLASNLGAE